MKPTADENDSRERFTHARAAAAALVCLSACLLLGCSMGRVHSRVQYWVGQTREHLPPGTPLKDAESFFAARGVKLRCCMSGPDIDNAYSATERDVGRFVFTEYSVLIVVDVAPDGLLRQVRVLRIGLGL
jgi:hypothetical protein